MTSTSKSFILSVVNIIIFESCFCFVFFFYFFICEFNFSLLIFLNFFMIVLVFFLFLYICSSYLFLQFFMFLFWIGILDFGEYIAVISCLLFWAVVFCVYRLCFNHFSSFEFSSVQSSSFFHLLFYISFYILFAIICKCFYT